MANPSDNRKYCSIKCGNISKRWTPEKFWVNVDKSGECWIWNGCLTHGYGFAQYFGQWMHAHRAAWFLTHGPLPSRNLFVCHDCPGGDNPRCVRPDHMFIGTMLDNMGDAAIKGTMSRGEEQWCSKLTPNNVRDIRARCANGEPYPEIAARYKIDRSNVGLIARRKSWKHID